MAEYNEFPCMAHQERVANVIPEQLLAEFNRARLRLLCHYVRSGERTWSDISHLLSCTPVAAITIFLECTHRPSP